MPDAEQWLEAQRDVWDLDAEKQSLSLELPKLGERLELLKLREAELRFALRALRKSSTPDTPCPPHVVEFEALLGRSESAAWAQLLKCLASPVPLGRLSRCAGRQGAEVLAQMAVALVQCEGAAGSVMEEVLKAEMEVLHSDQPLEEGSFIFAFLLGLSANDPDCEAWVAEAISEKTLDALRQLLSPDRARRAKNGPRTKETPARESLRKFSRAFVQPEISKTRSQDQLPVPSVADFIGEPEEALPQLSPVPSPRSTTPAVAFALPAGKEVELADHSDSPKRQEWAMRRANITNSTGSVLDLDGIAATLVQSLAEAAYAAPPTLCRLAAALRTFGDKGQDPLNDLLGRLLFVHWLVPALLKPALGLGLGLAEVFPVLTAAETTYSLRSLAQLLTAAVAHEAGPRAM
eukprot:g194.t1